MMKDSLDVTRSDQTISLPKGATLISKSGTHFASKVSSNVSDGMEWWDISAAVDGTKVLQTICPLEVEAHWELI